MSDTEPSGLALNYDQARVSILHSLGSMTEVLEESVRKTFTYHFVSQMQAAPFERAYFSWRKSGGVGERPADPASARAAIYNQAAPARQLEAFLQVLRISILEAAKVAAVGFESKDISLPLMMLRGVVERIANAVLLADALKDLKPPALKSEVPNAPLIAVGDKISRALYGTRVNWLALDELDWRTAKKEDIAYVRKELTSDMSVKSIMTAIDKLNKRVPGTRIAYEVLCEYLHPNVGDLHGATVRGESHFDMYGTRHVVRQVGIGPKDLSLAVDLNIILSKVLTICSEVIGMFPSVMAELEAASLVANQMTRKYAHRVRKRYRNVFQKNDLCPCLSGSKKCATANSLGFSSFSRDERTADPITA